MKRKHDGKLKKRAVCTGLFLAVLFGISGCVSPVQPTITPGETGTPNPVPTEELPPEPTGTPAVTEPVGTPAVGPTKPVLVTGTPSPEATSEVRPTPENTPTPEVTGEAVNRPTPAPTNEVTPELTGEPEQTPTPLPDAEITESPMPTPCPEYDTLLQNGWQRTEDFFGNREIFFAGLFTETQLRAEEGRYEYSYTVTENPFVSFSVIGEENQPLQLFLDDLGQKGTECVIVQEGESDYSYTYIEELVTVRGRVYSCPENENTHRMRVELRYPWAEESSTEGYDFYLR